MAADPRVGVVVITHERCEEALACLERLQELPERPQVVLVDNGSRDGTAEAVRRLHPWVDLLALPSNEGAVGRNHGTRLLRAPYVAFCDDDTWWEPGALTTAADALDAHARLAVVNARVVVEPGSREDPVNEELRDSPVEGPAWLPGPALGSFLAGASVLRRAAFEEVGGFSERLHLGGEEELLAADLASAGWELCHLPEIAVHHRASQRRDPHQRRRVGLRNTLWFTWLRRPVRTALRRTWYLARTVPHDAASVRAFAAAARGLPWVLRERRVVPDAVEHRLVQLEEARRTSTARQYVG